MEYQRNLLECRPAHGTTLPEDGKAQFYVYEWHDLEGLVDIPNRGTDLYKISLVQGAFKFWYNGQQYETGENTLLFVNHQLPYTWPCNDHQTGYCCYFNDDFLNLFEHFKDFPLFKGNDAPVFSLSPADLNTLKTVYDKMTQELSSDFIYKHDVLRTLVLEFVYAALHIKPIQKNVNQDSNASQRIVNNFMTLLEQQFPIVSVSQRIKVRYPVDFANHLSVHINHLNRAMKDVTGYTTTQAIARRIFKEARVLLQYTDWNISEIGWCLGFEELPHFINFFKKRAKLTPKAFRKQGLGLNAGPEQFKRMGNQ